MKRIRNIVVTAFAVVTVVINTLPASAQSSASLSIVPRKNYTIEAGKSVNDTLTIRNLDGERTLNLNLRVVDFSFVDDGGSPQLMLAEDAPQTTWSLKPFMTVPKTVTIPPKTSRTLDMSVAIPANQGAGSFYSAIVYSTGAPDGGNVGLSASGVTLVFTSIPGDVLEDLKLEKFGAYHKAVAGKEARYVSFTTQAPDMLAYMLKNNGNVTESPVGSITLKDIFGKERIISDINPNKSLALIGQERTFTTCIKSNAENVEFEGGTTQSVVCAPAKLWPGRYSAEINVFYGQNGNTTQEIVGKTVFWYLPIWFIIILLAVFLLIAFIVWRIVRWFKRKKSGPSAKKPSRRRN